MPLFRFLLTSSTYDDTVAFYAETMGLPVIDSWADPGRGTIIATAGDAQLEILEGEAPELTGGVAIAWEVDDIDAVYADLLGKGVSFAAPPIDQPWGHRNALLRAPGGLDITLFTLTGPES